MLNLAPCAEIGKTASAKRKTRVSKTHDTLTNRNADYQMLINIVQKLIAAMVSIWRQFKLIYQLNIFSFTSSLFATIWSRATAFDSSRKHMICSTVEPAIRRFVWRVGGGGNRRSFDARCLGSTICARNIRRNTNAFARRYASLSTLFEC